MLLLDRAEHWAGSGGFGPQNAHPKKTEELIYRPISDHHEQRFERVTVECGGGLNGSVSSVNISVYKL
jgi:hypothetical protein